MFFLHSFGCLTNGFEMFYRTFQKKILLVLALQGTEVRVGGGGWEREGGEGEEGKGRGREAGEMTMVLDREGWSQMSTEKFWCTCSWTAAKCTMSAAQLRKPTPSSG